MDIRIFIEKKSEYRSEALSLLEELKADFPLEGLRVIDIYDIFDLEEELRDKVGAIIADPAVDDVYYELDLTGKKYLAYEYLPGQYDQEANIARELIRLARPETRAVVQKGKVVIFEGDVDPEKAARYFINPADARRKDLSKLESPLFKRRPPSLMFMIFSKRRRRRLKKNIISLSRKPTSR
jgi:phosphoribosylformylglycinamidine synthase